MPASEPKGYFLVRLPGATRPSRPHLSCPRHDTAGHERDGHKRTRRGGIKRQAISLRCSLEGRNGLGFFDVDGPAWDVEPGEFGPDG